VSEYRDKVKGVGFLSKKGQTEKEIVHNEDDGSVAGHHVKHWDGRQDAVATPPPIRVKATPHNPTKGEDR